MWVPNSGDGTVTMINTSRNRVVGKPLKVGTTADRVSVVPGSVWVTSSADGTVTRIEPDETF
jgi:DNA-binding beta-propeller fold protein YncE